MRTRTNPVWYAVIGVLVVVLAGVLLFTLWPRDGEDTSPPVDTPSPTPSESVHTPDPDESSEPVVDPSSEDPGGSSGIDPDDFGGHPPAEVIEPLFPGYDGLSKLLPLAPELNGWKLDPSVAEQGTSMAGGQYVNDEGDAVLVTVHYALGHFERRMGEVTNHRQIGIAVCGDPLPGKGTSICAAAADDADLIARASGMTVPLEDMAGLLEAAVEFYRAERG